VFAGVVDLAGEGLEGELIRLDEVAAANLDRIKAGLVRQEIDDAFDVVGGFRATRAAIGAVATGVRVDADDLVVDRRDVIAAGGHDPRRSTKVEAFRPGALVDVDLDPERRNLAGLVGGSLDVGPLVAAVAGGEHVLGAGFDPFHRTAQFPGDGGDEVVLVVGADLLAEAAADLRRDAANAALR